MYRVTFIRFIYSVYFFGREITVIYGGHLLCTVYGVRFMYGSYMEYIYGSG